MMNYHFISTALAWKGRNFTQGTLQFATRNLTTSSLMGGGNIISKLINVIYRDLRLFTCSYMTPFNSITSYIIWEGLSLPRHTQVHNLPKFKEPKRDTVYNYAGRPINVPAMTSMSLHDIV